jgi:hypothetical protein
MSFIERMAKLSVLVPTKSVSQISPQARRFTALVPDSESLIGIAFGKATESLTCLQNRTKKPMLHRGDWLRRLVSKIYAMESLNDLEKYVDNAIAHFVRIMHEQNKNVNMGVFVQLFAFGRICFIRNLATS